MCPGPPDCPLPGPHLAGLQYHRPGPGADDQRYIGSKSWAYILVVIPTNLVEIPSILVVTTTSLEALPKMLTDILYSLLVNHIDLLLLF